MPSALNQAVFLFSCFFCLMDAASVFSVRGTSGDEVQHVNIRAALSGAQRWRLARELHRDVKRLLDEQFNREFGESANITSLAGVRLSTPVLKASDGCLSRNFSSEKCLGRIYGVVSWYKEHLSYIERENRTQSLMNDVRQGTKRLLDSINNQLQSRDTPLEISSTLRATSAWTRKLGAHSLLFNFTSVMVDTCRALSYMSTRRGAHTQPAKHSIEWISDKN